VLQAAAEFNARAAAANDWQSYAALYQMMFCNESWPELVVQNEDLRLLEEPIADGSLSLQGMRLQGVLCSPGAARGVCWTMSVCCRTAICWHLLSSLAGVAREAYTPTTAAPADVVKVSPELGLFLFDAANGTEPLQPGLQPTYLRRQYWPVLRDGQIKALLMSSVTFATEEDALAGRDAINGQMRMEATTNLWGGPAIQTPIDAAALRDVQTLMTALQQQL
jgi:hypothetical protein